MVGCIGERPPNYPSMAILSEMTPRSVLHLLRWVLLALALLALGRASAQDAHPLDLDETHAALNTIEATLKDKNLTDADLQRLRAENDPLGVALQAAIADMTPRLAASAKRLAELTPKSRDAQPATDVATAELESEKQKHDALDAKLRAARAMLLQVDDVATRIGAKRRELFARETFARSSSILNPQLWLSVVEEIPLDAQVMRSLIGGWLAGLGARHAPPDAWHGGAGRSAGADRRPAALGRPPVHLSRSDDDRPSRLRRAIAAAWTISSWRFCRSSASACWPTRSTPSTFPIRASKA